MNSKFKTHCRLLAARRDFLTVAAMLAASVISQNAFAAGYEAPTGTFGVGTYYSGVTAGLTGNALRLQLHTITSTGFTSISYGDSREDLPIVWTDPTNPLNMIQIYDHTSIVKPTGGSIPGWEYSNNVLVWNREHIWPQSWLGVSVDNSYSGPASDLFELAPADPSTNGGRGNDGYGNVTSSGAPGVNGSYFYPGDTDKGDAARSILYMATRYYTGCTTLSIQNLQLVNGSAYTTFQMGDLQSLLHYNYEDGVDNFERQRNQTIQSLQGDRNPFIDHPEYVWAIFGNTTNSSQISVGAPAANGASSSTITLPQVIVGATLGTSNVTVSKTGATPTTFNITGSGNATTTLGNVTTTLGIGTGQPFDYGNVTKTMTIGLNASTATAGLKSGAITIHNTDLTTAGTGMGSADGDDTVSISAAVLAHSNGSFNSTTDSNSLTVNFGLHAQNSGTVSLPFSISDLVATANFTAGLDLDSINVSGSSSAFSTNLAPFSNEAAGTSNGYNASIDTTAGGTYDATYTLNISDQNLPGATTGTALTLHLIGTVSSTQTVATLSGSATTTLNAVTLIVTGGGNFSGTLQDGTYPGFLVLTGGILTLSGNNTYSGSTTASGGSTLAFSNDSALGAGSTPVTLDGSTVEIDGTSQPTTSRVYTLGPGGGTFNITDPANTYTITSTLITNGPLTKTGLGALLLTQTFSTTFPTTLAQGTLELQGSANVAPIFTGNGTLKVDSALQLTSASTPSVSTFAALTLAGTTGAWTAGLDLTKNKLIVEDATNHATTFATLKDQVVYGATHAAGIYSTTLDANHTVAVVDNAVAQLTNVGGDTGIDAGSIIVADVLIGDANLDGIVDINDLTTVANHWQQPAIDWSQGDFDSSGLVDIEDLTAVALHWQMTDFSFIPQVLLLTPSFSPLAAVPEPTTLFTLVLVAPLMMRRRRV